MEHMNEIIKKFNDTTFNNPDAVELNKVYDLIRSASKTTCEIAFPTNVVLEVCKIFLNKVFGYYVGDKVDDNSLKHHLLIIHTLLAIPQAGHEECIAGVIHEIVMLIFDPSCNFWLCLHLVKLANKILVMQKNMFGKKYIGYGAIENYLLCRLMDRLFTCGDYVLQSSILELLFRLKKDIQNLKLVFFPKDFDLQRALDRINSETFDVDCRHFLNTVNKSSKNVFSLQAEFITADGRSLLPPSDFIKSGVGGNSHLWVDFNKDSHAITINVSLNCIVPIKLNEEDSDAVLIIIQEHAIEKFSRKKLKKDDMNLDLLIVSLSHSIVINNSLCKKFANKCKLFKIAFKSSTRVNHLHEEILGEIFKNKCTSKSNITSSSIALNRNPLPINVISSNSKSIYTSISEKSLGYLIQKDSEKFDTCPEYLNVVSNSVDLNIPKASRKKRATIRNSRHRKMSILDSISEDEEYHSQHLIHSTMKSGLVMVSTSVNFSDVTSIHSDSNKGNFDSRSIDAKNSACSSRSDKEIGGNRCENHVNEPIPSDCLQTMIQLPTVDQVQTVEKVQVPASNSRLLASKTNSEASKISQGSRYNTRSKNKLASAIVILENMKLPIKKDTYDMYSKTRKVSLSLRKRSSGRLSLPEEEKFIRTPEPVSATNHDLPEENEVKTSTLTTKNEQRIKNTEQHKKNVQNNLKDLMQNKLLQICTNSNENDKSRDCRNDHVFPKLSRQSNYERDMKNVESKKHTFATDKINTYEDQNKSEQNIPNSVSNNTSETIPQSPSSSSSKTIVEEPKIVENIKKVDVIMDDLGITDDYRNNSCNYSNIERSRDDNVKDCEKVKVFAKTPEVAGSSKGINRQSIKLNSHEKSQLTKKSATNVPEKVKPLMPNEKQTLPGNMKQATSHKNIFFNQFNADEEEVIQNTAYETLAENPSSKSRKRGSKNKPVQESSKENVDLNQSIIKSVIIENYQEISSLADEVWSQADVKTKKKQSRQNKKISKTGEKQQSSKQRIRDLKPSDVKKSKVANSEATSLGANSSLKTFNAKRQKSPEPMGRVDKLKSMKSSENRNADLVFEKSNVMNFDRSTNTSHKSCAISSADFAKNYTKLLQERSQINENLFKRRKSQSVSEITKKSTKRRKLYNLHDNQIPADKPLSECHEEEEINELTQEELDSKNYLFNKLISGDDSQTSAKFQKPSTEQDEGRTIQHIGQKNNRPVRSYANHKVDRKIEMSNCNKKMDGMISKKYVRRRKNVKNNSTIPINSIVTQKEGDLFDKLCQTNVSEQGTSIRKPNNTHIHKYEIMFSKMMRSFASTEKLMIKFYDTVQNDKLLSNM
ncbi:PREDICTED: synaptonemal complex protein 2-like [Nicrophorus vespilloides]|uniref:Synaptonemal complex protein 2-like n=1 Tax=Nicrophorus vespilloides TaxID=110193 RepID=A0ABM1NIN8_NICVS|nr:PREDICTED: synaptonemal complex protein 2-like [Nicrophorus vespilloides]